MGYRLRYDRRFMRWLAALPGDVRSVARQRVKALSAAPYPPQAKELSEHPGYYRLWLPRGCRLVYEVKDAEQIIELLYVGPKSPDLYENLGLGRQ
jgi:mRNA-degrading endonuclease RelE of RelBE toxin-antitoxin system